MVSSKSRFTLLPIVARRRGMQLHSHVGVIL
jgi:hypothetical protein